MERVKDFLIKKIYSISKGEIRESAMPLDRHDDESLFNLLRGMLHSEAMAEIEQLKEENTVLRNVIRSDEEQIKNFIKRNAEMRDDCIETARQRDLVAQEKDKEIERLRNLLDGLGDSFQQSTIARRRGYAEI